MRFAFCFALLLSLSGPGLAEQHFADPTGSVADRSVIVPADPPEAEGEIAGVNQCDPGSFADLLGKTGEEVSAMTFEVPTRVIAEDTVVTTDFLPERVNFELDAQGIVAEITCG